MKYRIVAEKPESKSAIYAWINEAKKMVYVGETCDLNRRMREHIRSMYDMEDSSNRNLVSEFKKREAPFYGIVICGAMAYNKKTDNLKKEWLLDETLCMYAFVQKGYGLYNGEDETAVKEGRVNGDSAKLRDNDGNRSFLRGNESEMYEKLCEYCSEKCAYNEDITKERLRTISNAVDKAIKRIGEIIIQSKDCKKRNHMISIMHEEENREKNYYVIDKDDNEKTVNKICNEISKIYLKKNDVKDLGIHPKSKEELLRMLDSNDLEKIAVCKFGNYASQSALTILRTKQYDIMHNTLEVKGEDISISKREGGDKGICFWAYGRSKTNEYRKYLSFDETDCAPRYLILPYVQSQLYATSKSDGAKQKNKDNLNFNPKDDESVEDFLERMKKYYKEGEEKARNKSGEDDRFKYDRFAFGYAWNRRNVNNKKGIKKHYPADMFPAVIRKFTCNDQGGIGDRNSVAFLISEFDYIDVPIDIDKFYEYFTSNTGRVLNKSLKGQNGVSCAKLSDKEGLKKYLSGCYDDKDDGEIRVFLARIEYPYVAALVKDPM